MHCRTEMRPSSGLPATLVAVVGVLLATACSDGDSTPTGPATEPSYIALLLPAVQSAREAARSQQATENPRFHIEQRLFDGGRAVGTAFFVDTEAGYRLHIVFHEGSIGCTDDMPFVHLLLSWHAVPAGETTGGGGIWNSGTMTLTGSTVSTAPEYSWIVDILPVMDQGPVRVVPELIRFEAELEVLFVADPCGAR